DGGGRCLYAGSGSLHPRQPRNALQGGRRLTLSFLPPPCRQGDADEQEPLCASWTWPERPVGPEPDPGKYGNDASGVGGARVFRRLGRVVHDGTGDVRRGNG